MIPPRFCPACELERRIPTLAAPCLHDQVQREVAIGQIPTYYWKGTMIRDTEARVIHRLLRPRQPGFPLALPSEPPQLIARMIRRNLLAREGDRRWALTAWGRFRFRHWKSCRSGNWTHNTTGERFFKALGDPPPPWRGTWA